MAGIPQIGNWGADLGNAFANIGAGMSKIVNPHQEIQMELQKRIAANPKIVQELFDQEIANPGSISSIYGPQVAAWLKNRSQSFASQVEGDTKKLYESDPTIAKDVQTKQLLGQTQAGRRIEGAQATTSEAAASVAPAKARNEQAQLDADLKYIETDTANRSKVLAGEANKAELANKNIDTVLKNWTKAEGVDFQKLARKVARNQTLTPEEQATLQIIDNPQSPHKETWQKLLSGVQNSDQLNEQRRYHDFAMNKENQDLMGKVIGEWRRLKSPGGSAVYLKDYMLDPNVSARAMQIEEGVRKGTIPEQTLSKDDAAYLAIQRAINQDEAAQRMVGDMKLGVQARLLRDQFKKADDEMKPQIVSEMTNILMQRAQNAGQPMNVRVAIDDGAGLFNLAGDLQYIVTMPDNTERILNQEGIEKLYESFQPKDKPIGTGKPQTPAYQQSRGGTFMASSDASNAAPVAPESEIPPAAIDIAQKLAALPVGQQLAYLAQIPDKNTRDILKKAIAKANGAKATDTIGLRPVK